MKKIIVLNSHPIQYYTPLYKKITDNLDVDIEVWFCSDSGVKEYFDKDFGASVKWDRPLLKGFKYSFLKNYSPWPGLRFPIVGLINFGIITRLYKLDKSIIWVDSWSQLSFLFCIFFGKIFGHKVCLRAETPLSHELKKNKIYLFLRKIYFYFFFKFIDNFFYIGTQNRLFYQFYGVKKEKLVFVPYSVDNSFFEAECNTYAPQKSNFKLSLNIPANHNVILFCGKLIEKKRPMDLLKVFKTFDEMDFFLVFLGSGPLENEIKSFVSQNSIKNVLITGFINQSEISKYYNLADIFVMCSGIGETWGLATNECMSFSPAIIVSDLSGCSSDLVTAGVNGFVFESGNVDELRKAILESISLKKENVKAENKRLLKIFSFVTSIQNLAERFDIAKLKS